MQTRLVDWQARYPTEHRSWAWWATQSAAAYLRWALTAIFLGCRGSGGAAGVARYPYPRISFICLLCGLIHCVMLLQRFCVVLCDDCSCGCMHFFFRFVCKRACRGIDALMVPGPALHTVSRWSSEIIDTKLDKIAFLTTWATLHARHHRDSDQVCVAFIAWQVRVERCTWTVNKGDSLVVIAARFRTNWMQVLHLLDFDGEIKFKTNYHPVVSSKILF